jgi:predicted RNA binding protein with dsRBD fold (UPF0201 family)
MAARGKKVFPYIKLFHTTYKYVVEYGKVNRHRRDAAAMRITLEARVYPTEDPQLVRQAMLNIFPDAVDDEELHGATGAGPSTVVMRSGDTGKLARRVAEQMIRDSARSALLRSAGAGRLDFCLNKQAALANRVNFTDCGSLLGDIRVVIECEDPRVEAMRIAGGIV